MDTVLLLVIAWGAWLGWVVALATLLAGCFPVIPAH